MESGNIINFVFPQQFMSKSHVQMGMHITYIGERLLLNLTK